MYLLTVVVTRGTFACVHHNYSIRTVIRTDRESAVRTALLIVSDSSLHPETCGEMEFAE